MQFLDAPDAFLPVQVSAAIHDFQFLNRIDDRITILPGNQASLLCIVTSTSKAYQIMLRMIGGDVRDYSAIIPR
jgi:hypothetical protein